MKICPVCQALHSMALHSCPQCGSAVPSQDGYPIYAPSLIRESDGFAQEDFARLFAVEAGHFWFEARNRLIIWGLRRFFLQMASYLEIGCGTGFVLAGIQAAFPDAMLYGSEILLEGLTYAHRRVPSAVLMQMDARNIPFKNEFDVIAAFDVLEHITEDEVVLAEMYKAAKPGGGVAITVPQHPYLWTQIDDLSFHKRRYTRRDLLRKVEEAGFAVLYVNSFVSVLFPVMLAARLPLLARREAPDPYAEFEISPWLNATLRAALDAERALATLGTPLPVGGSLILFARRAG